MKPFSKISVLAAGAAMLTIALLPVSAQAGSLQQNKNDMRNLAIVGGVAALYGLAHNDSGLALIGAAGAVLAGGQYENDRRTQSENDQYYDGNDRGRYYQNGYRTWDNGNVDRDNRDRDDRNRDNGNQGRDNGWGNGGRNNGGNGQAGHHYNHGDNGY